jgi:hypothetical protein
LTSGFLSLSLSLFPNFILIEKNSENDVNFFSFFYIFLIHFLCLCA